MRSDQAPPDAGFGAQLRRYRLMAGLSQEELAERSGLSVRAIANMERGRTARPHRRSLWRLAEALELAEAAREQLIRASRLMAGPSAAPESAAPGGAESGGAVSTGPASTGPASAEAAAMRPGPPALRCSLPPDTAAFTGRGAELSRTAALRTSAARCGRCPAVWWRSARSTGCPAWARPRWPFMRRICSTAQFPDRQLFVDLHGHTPGRNPVDPAVCLPTCWGPPESIRSTFPASVEGRAALWRDTMAGQRALLVLDNAASSAQVSPLLPGICWLPGAGHQPPPPG